MKKAYYLFNPGRMSRRDNTLKFQPIDQEGNEDKPRYLPVNGISALYIFGSIDANSALFNFLGQQHIPVHFFDYHKHYTGSFSPREYLLAGQMLIAQADAYRSKKLRMHIAQGFIEGSTFNMLKTIKYYINRGKDLDAEHGQIVSLRSSIVHSGSINELMGIEGNSRQVYYSTFDKIVEGYA